jgi:hypothetical protein
MTTHESPDLVVRLALGVEVASTLSSTHRQTGQGVLEDLLEAEELEDGQVDGGVESETALVRAESRVVLHSVASVDGDGSIVLLPRDSELDDSLGDLDNGEGSSVLGLLLQERLKGGGDLVEGLLELGLGGEVGHGCWVWGKVR